MIPLQTSGDLGDLLSGIADRPIVMLGEASHGTHEYYTWRAAISKKLIEEKGFSFIAVEGDWPDCYVVNRYVKGYPDAGEDIQNVLKKFDRWPTWMWGNWEIAALAEWLREYNKSLPLEKKVGFYGLDVYSLWDSMETMVKYLEKEDPTAANAARRALACFEPFQGDEHNYARFTLDDYGCRDEVLALLKEVRLKAQFLDGDREAGFNTEQNALIAVNAEKYYRAMVRFDSDSWNIRDTHMMETLRRLMLFHGRASKGIVWEHNTHIGDARATDMKNAGMINLGQLAREEYGKDRVCLVGFSSYKGTVMAGEEWGAPMQEMEVPAARDGSIESILHAMGNNDGYILLQRENDPVFRARLPHRAIGVVYLPSREKFGNYVPTILSERYDAFIFLDTTTALHPLLLHPDKNKLPGTYPFSL